MSLNLSAHKRLDGLQMWDPNPGSMRWQVLSEMANRLHWQRIAELGVKEGKTSYFLLQNTPAYVYSVDLWEPQEELGKLEKGEHYRDWNHNLFYQHFIKVTEQYRDRHTILKMTTTEAAKYIEDGSLDCVFIDACHAYECVKEDIEVWGPKVKRGGWIMGHDWPWETVQKAVKEKFEEERILPFPNKVWGVVNDR